MVIERKGEDDLDSIVCKPLFCSSIEVLSQTASLHCSTNTSILQSQPKLFERGIKSSGYGKVITRIPLGPRPTMARMKGKSRQMEKKKIAEERVISRKMARYPLNCNPLINHQAQHDDDSCISSIASVEFNNQASHIAISHFDLSVDILRVPFSKYGTPTHQLSKSSSGVIVRSAPELRLPSIISPHPCFSTCGHFLAYHNKVYSTSMQRKSGELIQLLSFPDEASNAQFFGQDRFALFSCKGCITLNHTKFHRTDNNAKGIQEPCRSWAFAGNVLALHSVNQSMSDLIAVSSSDRTIRIIDVATEKVSWKVRDKTGNKSAHSIAFPNTSASAYLPLEAYNLIAAGSVSEGGLITLFDLRTSKVVFNFAEHINRKDKCSIQFSPCMRYIATGNEAEGGALLYDIRRAGFHQTIKIDAKERCGRPFLDGSITQVAFNPIYPQLVTGSLNGKLRFYTEESLI